jgi:thiamine biosynthesis lipoprotein
MTEVVESSFHAMGSDVHVIVVDGPSSLLDTARDRIEHLEARWSRFRPDSEVGRLNASAGEALTVSDDTVALVTRAIDAWRFTGGSFDVTVLGPMLRAGYDRSFEDVRIGAMSRPNSLIVGCTNIEVDGNHITIPAGTGIDPGGIGKGLAADLVVDDIIAAGAAGVCVNMGGDARMRGIGPDGAGWTIAVEHPWLTGALVHLGISDGAIATSTTLKRRWTVDGVARHHLIDPATGEPSTTDLNLVTVIAGNAWAAEVLAKAVLIRGSARPFDLIDGSGAQALVVRSDGAVVVSSGFVGFCNGVTPPAFVRPEL